ncbi:MAG TPA: glycosyltransferase family 1 protein [Acidimicrobiales bacterium]|jgi:alpha-1,3-rhamnosyl/mannosyltransferase|nr:glycosyltransferase family 1 protein [Acidimicrobiales bacterium]
MNDNTLRVGINLLWLVPGVVGGTEEYATRQLEALAKHRPPGIAFTVFALAPFADAYPELTTAFDTVTIPLRGRVKPLRVAVENTWLAWQSRRHSLDVLHHLGGRIPRLSRVPPVVTIHDLQPLEQPQSFSIAKRLFLGRALPQTARRARIVITPTEYVRARVIERFTLSADRVVALFAPVSVRKVPTPRPEVLPPAVAALVDTRTPFFLLPAITYRYKNHRTVLDAFAGLREDRPDVRLVLTGGPGDAEDAVRAHIADLGLGESVLRTGRVPRPVLDLLLDHAVALVFPSRFEGFGLPVLEAMAAGCPVVASNVTALPEVVADAGTLVPPDDPAAWRAAMAQQLVASRGDAAAAGRRRAAAFGSESIANGLAAVYRAAASARPRDEARDDRDR